MGLKAKKSIFEIGSHIEFECKVHLRGGMDLDPNPNVNTPSVVVRLL